MQYTMKPRPTVYNGIHFRSRLEATWAAFFDRLGWRWEYEHEEIAGWLPDFSIRDAAGFDFLVEVKPEITFSPGSGVMKKMEKSRGDKVVLLVSAPFACDIEYHGGTVLGVCFPCPWGFDEWETSFLCETGDGFAIGSIADKLHDGDELLPARKVAFSRARSMWGKAKKATRYEPA
jgi:hypothetical protein